MDIFVMDSSFHIIGLIDSYTSIIWATRYYISGDFELYLPATDERIELLKQNYYLCRKKDAIQTENDMRYKNVMVIEKVEITTDVEQGNFIIVSGRSLKSILKRRIIWNQTNLSGKLETGIRQLINENVINPQIEARKIPNFILGNEIGIDTQIDMQVTGENLGDTIESICAANGCGYDVDVVNGAFEFYLYVGVDRSYNQSENPFVVFSDTFENLVTTDYSYDLTEYKNAALVAGEGEGINKRTQAVGEAAGLERFEMYVDANGVSNNAGDYSLESYLKLLETEGINAIAENSFVETFAGQMQTRTGYVLNEDYFLGDIVQVRNEYGIEASPRILEIIESDDENGTSILPTFSTLEVEE